MRALLQHLTRPIGTKNTDARLAMYLGHVSAVILFGAGVLKIWRLELNETATLGGLLLVTITSLLLSCFGSLNYLVAVYQPSEKPERAP